MAASQQAQLSTRSCSPKPCSSCSAVDSPRRAHCLAPAQHLQLRDQLTPVWQQRLPFLLALAYFQSGDYGKATLHFERARDSYPELRDYTLWYLGEGLRRLDRLPSARMAYQWLVDAFPDSVHHPEALFQAAEINARLGDLRRAAEL